MSPRKLVLSVVALLALVPHAHTKTLSLSDSFGTPPACPAGQQRVIIKSAADQAEVEAFIASLPAGSPTYAYIGLARCSQTSAQGLDPCPAGAGGMWVDNTPWFSTDFSQFGIADVDGSGSIVGDPRTGIYSNGVWGQGNNAHYAVCELIEEPEPELCVDSSGVSTCHPLAYCTDGACECQPGTRDVGGSGTDCADTGYAVRFVLADDIDDDDLTRRASNPSTFTDEDVLGTYCDAAADGWFLSHVDTDLTNAVAYTAVYCIYANETVAGAALSGYQVSIIAGQTVVVGPRVYAWTLPTTSNPLYVPPTGMEVQGVFFDTNCAQSGCWVISGVLTTGQNMWENNAFNTFYLPHAEGSDALSYDYDYTAGGNGPSNDVAVEWTFAPAKHPCTSANFDASGGNTQEVTTCCITNPGIGEDGGAGSSKGGFLANYRTTTEFATWAAPALADCTGAAGEVIERPGYTAPETSWTVPFPTNPANFLFGQFTNMGDSPGVTKLNVTDPFFGQYDFTIELDEVELRKKAGKLTGTVGVEHTVDTFVGLTNFRTTGEIALDTFSTQTAIHLEKTSFFSVSTHGTNDYTFLEYVNLRLVAVYSQDKDFSGSDESADRTVRTVAGNQANYIQVTFTLGAQYNVDPAGSPLIPSDSVRAGHGTFFDTGSADMLHMCDLYSAGDARFDATTQSLDFADLLVQECAPQTAMCASPSSIPDSFVVFNIPLGVDYFANTAGGPSDTLANNIFVELVVSAAESGDTREDDADPNSGGDPQQMKTTLTASIPIVEGGINIFCDGFTAKTDLEDVADADIVVGSASSLEELTRLRILKDIASTQMNPNEITEINSDSIEAGLMTLVLKGNQSYFGLGGRGAVSIELEDVITIHIMEDTGSGVGTGKDAFVLGKLNEAPEDNTDSNGLIVDGYCLNGAFCFEIERASQRAHLQPTSELLAECPFNPPRPAGSASLETCVTRRDVQYREFPARTGAYSTAMELCTGGKDSCGAMEAEQWFFTTILGNNDYAKSLATSYANVIADQYNLNGVYRRAYWINPGYEWTPTQTGGTPIFSVSQKLYLFALITLDEGLTDPSNTGASLPYSSPVLPRARRRMLLQSVPGDVNEALQDGQSEMGGGVFEFQTSPMQLMAKAFDVPQDKVATFTVQLQLTEAEACMSKTELQTSIRSTLDDYLSGAASPYYTVQVVSLAVDKADVQCSRRTLRSLLSSFSSATADVTMLVVFEEGHDSVLSVAKLAGMAGVQAVEPLSVAPGVDTAVPNTYQPPAVTSSDTGSGSDGGSSSNVGMIAGAAAGGAVAIAAIVGAVIFFRKRDQPPAVIQAVQSISVEDLKGQLAADE